MSGASEKYKDLFKNILAELQGQDPVVDEILKPMRIYLNDIERFSSPVIFLAKFRAFLADRDRRLIDTYLKKEDFEHLQGYRELQTVIDGLLAQVLGLLEDQIKAREGSRERLHAVIDKVRDAKTLNNLRRLSDVLLEAGEQLIEEHTELMEASDKLSDDLHCCRAQIEELEGRLAGALQDAEKDHLTGLHNRRMFDRDLDMLVCKAREACKPISMMLVDLDHFKQINDRWGHAVGDDVLVNFARLMRASLREVDRTYRLGGDEFAVIFVDCGRKKALSVAERVRAYVAEHEYSVGEVHFRLSISGGVAQLAPKEVVKAFYQRTDRMLYLAKQNGRGRIECAT